MMKKVTQRVCVDLWKSSVGNDGKAQKLQAMADQLDQGNPGLTRAEIEAMADQVATGPRPTGRPQGQGSHESFNSLIIK